MRIQMVTRHCDVGDESRARAEELITKLRKFDPRVSSAEVIFTEEGRLKRAEGILHVDGMDHVVAHADADDFMAAVDQMSDRLGRILRRKRAQDRDHKAPSHAERALDAS